MFDFDDEALEQLDVEPEVEPLLVCFYSGGFTHKEGQKMTASMLKEAAKLGLGDSLVLGHPDHYDIKSEGHDGYPDYIDALVEEIDSEEFNRGRPLLIFGHSRGGCGAMALATRLGSRVKKIYICGNGPIIPGEVTAWEKMSKQFKAGICPTIPDYGPLGGDGSKALLTWFFTLDQSNLMLKELCQLSADDLPAALAQSPAFSAKVKLMKVQYMDAVYPRMTGDDAMIKRVSVPMMVGVTKQEGMTLETSKEWETKCTTGPVQHIEVDQGHMDCLDGDGPLVQAFIKDMAKFVSGVAS